MEVTLPLIITRVGILKITGRRLSSEEKNPKPLRLKIARTNRYDQRATKCAIFST
jgi:hypothetical protein